MHANLARTCVSDKCHREMFGKGTPIRSELRVNPRVNQCCLFRDPKYLRLGVVERGRGGNIERQKVEFVLLRPTAPMGVTLHTRESSMAGQGFPP